MIEKWLKMLAGFVVDALLARFGIAPDEKVDLDGLIAKGAIAMRTELKGDLQKLDDIPQQVISQVSGQINGVVTQLGGLPGQIAGQVIGQLPNFGALINDAIQNLNPFRPR
jgi:hypothetical protein